MRYRVVAPFAYVHDGCAVHVSKVGASVEVPAGLVRQLLKSGVIAKDVLPEPERYEIIDVDELVEGWPDLSDPKQVWVDFAVSRGVKRSTAQAMSKTNLVKTLDRMEGDDDGTVS